MKMKIIEIYNDLIAVVYWLIYAQVEREASSRFASPDRQWTVALGIKKKNFLFYFIVPLVEINLVKYI